MKDRGKVRGKRRWKKGDESWGREGREGKGGGGRGVSVGDYPCVG